MHNGESNKRLIAWAKMTRSNLQCKSSSKNSKFHIGKLIKTWASSLLLFVCVVCDFLTRFCALCVCVRALFDLRYPGVHQSGSGSGQHQRGGRWTLPRHEWERRALWVGESKRNNLLSFTSPPSPCCPQPHSQVWHSTHVTCSAEYTTL